MIIIEWASHVVSILTLIALVVSFFTKPEEYISNITIKQTKTNEIDSDVTTIGLHRSYDFFDCDKPINSYILYPKHTNFKTVTFYRLELDTKNMRIIEKEKLKTFTNVDNKTAIIIHTTVPELIPNLKVKWKVNNGLKGEYNFQSNGFNGNVDIDEYLYKKSLLTKLKVFLGI